MDDLFRLTIYQASELLRNKEISSVELTRSCLDRVDQVEDRVKSFVTITKKLALKQAALADERLSAKRGTRLTGIPTQIKDVINTKDIRTTCASRMLEHYVPPYSATVVERLNAEGMVLLGKGNMDEFAMGSSTENSAFFPSRNPWDLTRVPGGSSGGGAVAVSSGEVGYALGSDTGGSIRQPAALCGVVGIKPTYGLVSRYGLIAYASSLDQIGPITKDITDCSIVLKAIAGHDPRDSTSIPYVVPDYPKSLTGDINGLRIGIPKEYFIDGMQTGVKDSLSTAIQMFGDMGASVEEVSLPTTPYALACYYILALSEASANLARYDGVKYGFSYTDTDDMWEAMERTRQYGFGIEVKRRIMLGAYALSTGYYDAYYLKAQKVRTLLRREFEEVFKGVDVLITPTTPTVAFPIGEKTDDPVEMYLSDVHTVPINVVGLPAVSIPCGMTNGLPVGMQIVGPPLSEGVILNAAYTYEQATDWHNEHPAL